MSDSPVVKYGLALLAVAVALVLRLWLNPFIGLDAPFLTFFLAVMAAAAYGGFGPGLLAAFASTLVADYFFIEPLGTLNVSTKDFVALGVFVMEVSAISLLSERLHRAKREAQKEQRNVSRILGSIDDAFVALDARWVYTLVNDEAARIIGKRREELIGQHLWTLFPQLVGTQAWSELQAAMADRTPRTVEVYDDATRRWYEKRLYPYEDGLSVFIADVTARRQAEDALRRTNESLHRTQRALEEAGRRLEGHLTHTPLGVIEWDEQFRITRWAGEAPRIFGWTAEEMLGRQLGTFRWVHEDDVERVAAVAQRLREEPRVISCNRNYDKWGRVHDCEWYSSTVMKDGRMESVLSLVLDVTARKQDEQQLKWWAATLEQRVEERTKALVESQRRLRELATELTVTEQRTRDRLAGDLHDYLAQLLVLARLKLGQVKSSVSADKPKDLVLQTEDVLQQALAYTRTLVADLSPPILREGGLCPALRWLAGHMQRFDLDVDFSTDEPAVEVPAEQALLIFQSIRELLMNVVKHAKATRARVVVARQDGALRFMVQDDGQGFAQVAATGAPKGFGLFTMRERLQALGGRLAIESVPGRGTTATLVLPLAEAQARGAGLEARGHEDDRETALISHPLASGPSPLASSRIRVLLVDDHVMFRQGLKSVVESYPGVEVIGEAGNGMEAIDLADRLRPHVVVMDINMPVMDGVEATKCLKARRPAVTVIGLSLHVSSEMERRMREAGASAYLTKESAVEQLYEALTGVLGQRAGAPT